MKKLTKALILLLSVVFLFTSCEGSLSDVLSKMMSPFENKNLFMDAGMIKKDSASTNAVKNLVSSTQPATIKTENGMIDLSQESLKDISDALKAAGIENVQIDATTALGQALTKEGGILPSYNEDQKKELTSNLNDILSDSQKRNDFKTQMEVPASENQIQATKNTFGVGAAVIDEVKNSLASSEDDTTKQVIEALSSLQNELESKAESEKVTTGDVLQAQMLTNLVSSAAQVTSVEGKTDSEKKEVTMKLIDDAVLFINTTKAISGGLALEKLDIDGLLSGIGSDTSAVSHSVSRAINGNYFYLETEDAVKNANLYRPLINLILNNGEKSFNKDIVSSRAGSYQMIYAAYKMLYSVIDSPSSIYLESIPDTKKGISAFMDVITSIVNSELPKLSSEILGNNTAYLDHLDYLYKNSTLFTNDTITVDSYIDGTKLMEIDKYQNEDDSFNADLLLSDIKNYLKEGEENNTKIDDIVAKAQIIDTMIKYGSMKDSIQKLLSNFNDGESVDLENGFSSFLDAKLNEFVAEN